MKRNPVWQGMVSGFLELLMLIWLLPGMTIGLGHITVDTFGNL